MKESIPRLNAEPRTITSRTFQVTHITYKVWSFLCMAEICYLSAVSRDWRTLVQSKTAFRYVTSLVLHETFRGTTKHVCGTKSVFETLPVPIPVDKRCPPRHMLNHILKFCTRLTSILFCRCTDHTCTDRREPRPKRLLVDILPLEFPPSLTSVTICGSICDADLIHLSSCRELTTFKFTSKTHAYIKCLCRRDEVSQLMLGRLATELPSLSVLEIDSQLALPWLRHADTLRSLTCRFASIRALHMLFQTASLLEHINVSYSVTNSPCDIYVDSDEEDEKYYYNEEDGEYYEVHPQDDTDTEQSNVDWKTLFREDIRGGRLQSAPLRTFRGIFGVRWCHDDDDDDILQSLVRHYPLITDLYIPDVRFTNPVPTLALLPLRKLSLKMSTVQMIDLLPSLSQLTDLDLREINITPEVIAGLPRWTPSLSRLRIFWANDCDVLLAPVDWIPLQHLPLTYLDILIHDERPSTFTDQVRHSRIPRHDIDMKVEESRTASFKPIVTPSVLARLEHLTHLIFRAEVPNDGYGAYAHEGYAWTASEIRDFAESSKATLEIIQMYIVLSTVSVWADVLSSAAVFKSLRSFHASVSSRTGCTDTAHKFVLTHPVMSMLPFDEDNNHVYLI